MADEEFTLFLCAAIIVVIAYRVSSRASIIPLTAALPSYLKYKERWLMPVRDQGPCAACWSYSVVDMMADTLNVWTAGGYGKRPLSAQYLLSCSKAHEGCDVGGSPEAVYNLPQMTDVGCPLDADLPYEGKVTECKQLPPDAFRVRTIKNTAVDLCDDPSLALPGTRGATIKRNVENMKRALMAYGPIVGTIRVTEDLYAYKADGIYRGDPTSKLVGYHAIEIIGWCCEAVNIREPGFDSPAFWICRSSWGVYWGVPPGVSSGFAFIEMGANVCDIESRASVCRVNFPKELAAIAKKTPLTEVRYESYTDYADDPERQNFIDAVHAKLGDTASFVR
ncbi:FirrV-1-A48 precursor [Tribonema minus]|uniref:FirrV-1-A48 n=1 Tax=Tribonema minus TaxID=303371 RepID=A0A836CER7_9STRA|nr:FirrV-1-A48 precursor [Tribonema minus]